MTNQNNVMIQTDRWIAAWRPFSASDALCGGHSRFSRHDLPCNRGMMLKTLFRSMQLEYGKIGLSNDNLTQGTAMMVTTIHHRQTTAGDKTVLIVA